MIDRISNEFLKSVNKLNQKKYRLDSGKILIEGERLISQIFDYIKNKDLSIQSSFEYLLIDENKITNYKTLLNEIASISKDTKIMSLSTQQANKLSNTITSQNIFAILNFKTNEINKFNKIIYLDSISDPGNMGTIIRTATAFDIDGIVLSKNCCELSNPKVVRASMGSIFYIPFLYDDDNWITDRKELIYISDVQKGTPLTDFTFPDKPYILVLGSEAIGVNINKLQNFTDKITIPIKNKMESLNVSIAAGIFFNKMFNDSLHHKYQNKGQQID
ncbi:MAG: RNA methyltransferase [Candidatus Cloacimonetes bacterium]|nr:RNA methyltransferase [Candidatus Cloacimonadota bacterium]